MTLHSSLSDTQLVRLLQKDDAAAFSEMYTRYAASLVGFASAKLYNLEDSRDIIQDIFVKLWHDRNTLKIDKTLEAYLFASVRYRIIDKVRKNITREEYAGIVLSLQISYQSEIEQRINADELKAHVTRALEKLSPRVRQIYLLSREQHLSISEIAEKLVISEQTVKNQLTAALRHLRESLSYLPISTLFFALLFFSNQL